VHYVPDKKNVPSHLDGLVQQGDMVITMGAGDIWRFGEEFIRLRKGRSS
jgi:UDP-N-acetylmuramate--alanine ligase